MKKRNSVHPQKQTAEDKLFETIMSGLSTFERCRRSQKIKMGIARKKTKSQLRM